MPKPKDPQLLARLGARFRDLRVANDMTQEGIAEALDVQVATISRWERGRAGLSFPILAQAAALFGIGLGELLAIDSTEVPRASGKTRKMLELWDRLDRDQRDAILSVIESMTRR